MTTDPPPPPPPSSSPEEFEQVKILHFEGSIPSAICTNKQIFNQIFSLETWKTVLGPDQRDRILKMLPPELQQIPGLTDLTIEQLFNRSLSSFNQNPLDTLFDKLLNGHYDPEVVQTKANIVKEWRRDSFRLRKLYHTKLLQDIVISRDKTLRKLIPPLTKMSQNFQRKKSQSHSTSISPSAAKKAAKALQASNGNHPYPPPPSSKSPSKSSENSKKSPSKKSPKKPSRPPPPPPVILPPLKKSPPKKSKPSKKSPKKTTPTTTLDQAATESAIATVISEAAAKASQAQASQSTNLLLGTLTSSTNPLEPPTLSLRSPPGQPPPPPSALLDSLTLTNPPPPPIPPPKPLPSPVQSSPILASQLQAPSPISINLSTITGGSSANSLTLNYTQPPPSPQSITATAPPLSKSLSEFEFEAIEPTIGFSGPPKPQPSLLTTWLNQPASSSSVSTLLANNILTSTPVPIPVPIPKSSPKSPPPPYTPPPPTLSSSAFPVDPQSFVTTLMASSKDLLTAFGSTPPKPSPILLLPQTSSTLTPSSLTLPSSILQSTSTSTKPPPPSSTITSASTSTLPNLLSTSPSPDLWTLSPNPITSDLCFSPTLPNLSDELDGLDLDLDGLCDFEFLLGPPKPHASFFSLIRDVLCSTRDHRMTLICLEKTIKKWTLSPTSSLNSWFNLVSDWTYALLVALNFLAGNYTEVHPEDFVPYIEYKYKTKYYQWIGAGRDGDNNLTPLCSLWMDNLDKLPPLRKNEIDGHSLLGLDDEEDLSQDDSDGPGGSGGPGDDSKKRGKRPQTPPPPRCTTEWNVRPSTEEEKVYFRNQEKLRFENPHKAFTYRMHGYESVVGPVKGVYSSQTGVTNKARGHSLLVDDRPPYVTILALVRDAVARLPNGEGTRSEICEMLRDSQFLAQEASNVTLNSVVSGALDRLHYERDPCVRYDSHKKSWIYLHRDRGQEQFERMHHNRSYTKSTKTRNNFGRKLRKGSKSSAGTSSSSSSQCSTSALVENCLGIANQQTQATLTALTVAAPTAQGTLVLPQASTIAPGGKPGVILNVNPNPNPGTRASGITAQVQAQAQSLNDVLALNAGGALRFQPGGLQVLQGAAGGQAFIQDGARLVLQQGTAQAGGQGQQGQPQILLGSATGSAAATAAAAVLKLAGAQGLRFAQLKLPQGQLQAQTPQLPQSQQLRMPQHRILLARGQGLGNQGLLLGQTSTGQTVILSAGPPGAGGALAGQLTLATAATPQATQQQQSSSVPKYGIITTSLPQVVSSSGLLSPNPAVSFNSSAMSMPGSRLLTSTVSTLPSTTISLPASLLPPSSSSSSSSTTSGVAPQPPPPPNVVVSTSQLPPSNQSESTQQTTQQQSAALTAALALQQQQSLILHGHSGQGQPNHSVNPLTTAPIIIRSAQGDFVSFGIPSHLSLGRGMQGIKVIPFQSGKQTVLARIVGASQTPPVSPATGSSSGSSAITSISSSAPLSTSSVITSHQSQAGNPITKLTLPVTATATIPTTN